MRSSAPRGDSVTANTRRSTWPRATSLSSSPRAATSRPPTSNPSSTRILVIGRAALAGESVQIPDVLADPDYSYGAQQIVGYRALLGVPIVLDEELIGAIVVGRNTPGSFAENQVELVKAFADQSAIAISNARLFEAIERQRTELSRFVSPQVAELVATQRGEELLAGHRAYISCLFCDLRGFTAFAETAAPEEL